MEKRAFLETLVEETAKAGKLDKAIDVASAIQDERRKAHVFAIVIGEIVKDSNLEEKEILSLMRKLNSMRK